MLGRQAGLFSVLGINWGGEGGGKFGRMAVNYDHTLHSNNVTVSAIGLRCPSEFTSN